MERWSAFSNDGEWDPKAAKRPFRVKIAKYLGFNENHSQHSPSSQG